MYSTLLQSYYTHGSISGGGGGVAVAPAAGGGGAGAGGSSGGGGGGGGGGSENGRCTGVGDAACSRSAYWSHILSPNANAKRSSSTSSSRGDHFWSCAQ